MNQSVRPEAGPVRTSGNSLTNNVTQTLYKTNTYVLASSIKYLTTITGARARNLLTWTASRLTLEIFHPRPSTRSHQADIPQRAAPPQRKYQKRHLLPKNPHMPKSLPGKATAYRRASDTRKS